jgi:hypothetical protein
MSTDSRVAEPANAPGDLTALESTLKNATAGKPDASAPTGTSKQSDDASKPDWIEDKFWNGDLTESMQKQAQAYKPLQSTLGRMANDLGTQRKLTDQILALDKRPDTSTPSAKTPPKVDPRALVDDPTATLDAYWQQREAALRKEFEDRQAQSNIVAAEHAFRTKHGDFDAVTSDPKFASWVKSSPLRTRAAALAGQGNYVIADELLTEYKALNGKAPAPAEDPNRGSDDAATDAARKAALESAAQSGGAGSGAKGPVYRRADLIKLKMEKPQVYSDPTFQNEILRAYAEGRVK